MSHTWKYNDTTFIGNSDLSGDITVITDGPAETLEDGSGRITINISGEDLLMFMEHMLRQKLISKLKDISLL